MSYKKLQIFMKTEVFFYMFNQMPFHQGVWFYDAYCSENFVKDEISKVLASGQNGKKCDLKLSFQGLSNVLLRKNKFHYCLLLQTKNITTNFYQIKFVDNAEVASKKIQKKFSIILWFFHVYFSYIRRPHNTWYSSPYSALN